MDASFSVSSSIIFGTTTKHLRLFFSSSSLMYRHISGTFFEDKILVFMLLSPPGLQFISLVFNPPKSTKDKLLGIGVALITSWSILNLLASVPRAKTPKRCCSSVITSARFENSIESLKIE